MAATVALGLSLASTSFADTTARLAKELAEVRGEVEGLSQELSSKQTELQNELKSHARQKAEVAAEVQREKMRLQKVRQAVLDKTKVVADQEQNDKALRPGFESALQKFRAYVESAMPFRRGERLAEIDKIADQYKSGMLSPERALARLWAFAEDEFRLTHETGVYRQTVAVDGKEQLADVVRVGMVMMFYRTADGGYGHVERANDNTWRYRALAGKDNVARIEGLFESLRKQIRVGLFQLPPAIAGTVTP